MKCDEVKPTCGPCAKGSRACVYGELPAARNSSASETGNTCNSEFGPAPPPPCSHQSHPSFSSSTAPTPQVPQTQQWPATPGPATSPEESFHVLSPQSSYSNSTGYGTEVAPLRWFGLLAGDAVDGESRPSSIVRSAKLAYALR